MPFAATRGGNAGGSAPRACSTPLRDGRVLWAPRTLPDGTFCSRGRRQCGRPAAAGRPGLSRLTDTDLGHCRQRVIQRKRVGLLDRGEILERRPPFACRVGRGVHDVTVTEEPLV